MSEIENIRNFCIIAHIDHGKSTLADRLLELTGTVKRGIGERLLDTLELEKERGITIKLNPARMLYRFGRHHYQLNLIDTPGHTDFHYEVSRSLAAVEGAILLADATRGVQAQTLANFRLAHQLQLSLIPVVNKIDLPNAQPQKTAQQLSKLLSCSIKDICYISGKTGEGVDQLLEKIVNCLPPPPGRKDKPLRALVFDSFYDKFLGVIAYAKIIDGSLAVGQHLAMAATGAHFNATQVGYLKIERQSSDRLETGEIGYVATGLKDINDCRVGDTIHCRDDDIQPLPGYKHPKPMVFASFFPEPKQTAMLSQALGKLKLNDASLVFEPVSTKALGQGFTVGCLGLLHLEIVKERLEREYNLTVFTTTPTVAYRTSSEGSFEPWVELEIVAPTRYYGSVIELATHHRGVLRKVEYFDDQLLAYFDAPLAEVMVEFHDQLKSVTAGYGSMDYQLRDYRPIDLVTVDLVVAGTKIDALSHQVIRSRAERYSRTLIEKLKNLIPRQNFAISLQAAIGGRIIARGDIPAYRKDVTAKLYGGDVTRKKKLLEKQKRGKERLRRFGQVEIPHHLFWELLKNP